MRVKSVGKAAQLLDIMASAGRPMALKELAELASLPKSTAHGLLSALRDAMLAEQSPEDGKYRLGIKLFELGCAVGASWNVSALAAEHMRGLAEETGETAYLTMFSGGETVVIDKAESSNAMHVASPMGSRLPAHCTSQGKVFLAYRSASETRRILKERGMTSYTPHTITALERLEAECAQARERGYAIEDGEYRIGLRAVSAPIMDVNGNVDYAIGVVGMFRRTQSEEFIRATELVARAAREISRKLGYRE